MASPDGRDDSVTIHADARLYHGLFQGDEAATLVLAAGRRGYVFVVAGSLQVNGQALAGGDALALESESQVRLEQGRDAEVLVFDLD